MYASKQHMIDQYGEEALIELTDRALPATGEIVDSVLDGALEAASALCDGYLAKRYRTPVSNPPLILRRHAMAIAYFDLHRGHYPDEIRAAYDDAMAFLKQVSRGDIILDVAGVAPTSSPAEAHVDAPDRMFNRDTLKRF